ncbi:hypothetical protein [Vreelandella profundi]|uniref:hypothetical protein n=1 Tax=Vreelandella profundi TaxID=2852117 RepID=UPI001EF0F1B8|nr:hypothetical protein [Halomonas profundi]
MDKQCDRVNNDLAMTDNQTTLDQPSVKRPHWLTLCMMATAASVIVLAGCGDSGEDAAVPQPAEESAPLEQDTTAEPAAGMSEEPAMEQDPGLNEDPASQGSMNQSIGAGAEGSMSSEDTMSSEDPMSTDETMPEGTMDEPAEGTMNPDEDEAGFGEGTDPMPGDSNANDDDETSSNS